MTLKTRILRWILPAKRCRVCGRLLITRADRRRGMGKTCARKFNAITVLPKINKDGGEDL